jgi:hypothetical protein
MRIFMPFKHVAIVLGCLSVLILNGYFVWSWIEHKDPVQVHGATHIVGAKTAAHPVSPHKDSFKAAPTVSH